MDYAALLPYINTYGYLAIFFFMALESSFFPFPSELVMIPAGYLSALGHMSLIIALIVGTLGNLVGAYINYWLAARFGEAFLLKHKNILFIDERVLKKTEKLFQKHGAAITFTGRLIPVVRQYISFPAGLAKMDLRIFFLYTFAGSFIWDIFLLAIGYFVGLNQTLISKYTTEVTLFLLILIFIVFGAYWYKEKFSARV